jgi:hypothetical protein
MERHLLQLRRDRRKRGVEFGPEALDDANYRNGNSGGDQAIFNGSRGALVFKKSDDQAHERLLRKESPIAFYIGNLINKLPPQLKSAPTKNANSYQRRELMRRDRDRDNDLRQKDCQSETVHNCQFGGH